MINRRPHSRVHLPKRCLSHTRVNVGSDTDSIFALVDALANRIGSLPGVECRVVTAGDAEGLRHYYLDKAFTLDPATDDAVFFAALDSEGRVSLSISREETEEITRTGWGELKGGRIRTSQPRDTGDLTVLWRIILMAYFDIAARREFRAWRDTRYRPRHPGPAESRSAVIAPGAFF